MGGLLFNGYKGFLWDDEKVLEIVMMVINVFNATELGT